MVLRWLWFVLFGCTLFLPAKGQAEQLRPQLDDMVLHFGNVVFGREYDTGIKNPVISKWLTSPVGITVQGRATKEMELLAARHARNLTRLTKIKFRKIEPGTPGPSIDLIFLKRRDMGKLKVPNTDPRVIQEMTSDPRTVCFFLIWHQPPEQIVKAIVVANAEADLAHLNSCLLEELTQVMGLPNDVQSYWPSMFHPNDMGVEHSIWDKLYLKTLYDPRMKPGMKPAEALQVAKGIFADALEKLPK